MWTEAEAFYVYIVAKPKNTPEFKGEGDSQGLTSQAPGNRETNPSLKVRWINSWVVAIKMLDDTHSLVVENTSQDLEVGRIH